MVHYMLCYQDCRRSIPAGLLSVSGYGILETTCTFVLHSSVISQLDLKVIISSMNQ